MQKRKTKRRRASRKGRLNAVKNLLEDKNVCALIVEIIRTIIKTMKG
jgi:DNA-binding FrmR family transcriptional regulator